MADIENRVYVLETKQEEYERRQREHSEQINRTVDLMNTLANNTAVMNHTLEMLVKQVIPKVEAMEKKVDANTMITKAAMWLTGIVITAGVSAIVALV